jgi:hypothetical protein
MDEWIWLVVGIAFGLFGSWFLWPVLTMMNWEWVMRHMKAPKVKVVSDCESTRKLIEFIDEEIASSSPETNSKDKEV